MRVVRHILLAILTLLIIFMIVLIAWWRRDHEAPEMMVVVATLVALHLMVCGIWLVLEMCVRKIFALVCRRKPVALELHVSCGKWSSDGSLLRK